MKVPSNHWALIKAGAVIEMQSPGWDGDDPKTHIQMTVRLKNDIVVCLGDDTEVDLISAVHKPEDHGKRSKI